MHWIYIRKCYDNFDNQFYYVGETKRLYRRFIEHEDDKCLNTFDTYSYPVAIYKKDKISNFLEYNQEIYKLNNDDNYPLETYFSGYNNPKYILDNFEYLEDNDNYSKYYAENNIAECLMIHNKNNWENIRGGKYTRFDCNYKFPKNKHIEFLPLCKCGLPCDVKKNEDKNYLFFRCSKKNMWDSFREEFDIDDEPCNFYKEYTEDKIIKTMCNKKEKKIKNLLKKSYWLMNIKEDSSDPYGYCVGNCKKQNMNYNYIKYGGRYRTLCYDCFINKNKELQEKYDIQKNECFILSDSD